MDYFASFTNRFGISSLSSMILFSCSIIILKTSHLILFSLSSEANGMQHELIHHFIRVVCRNGDLGFTRNTLQSYLIRICDMRLPPSHVHGPLWCMFHEVLSTLRLTEIIHYHTASSDNHTSMSSLVHQSLIAAAQMRPSALLLVKALNALKVQVRDIRNLPLYEGLPLIFVVSSILIGFTSLPMMHHGTLSFMMKSFEIMR
jgi:hypothetical protein